MRTCNCFKFVLALFGLGLTAIQTRAQSIYTPYAFTNFAGAPGGPGIADGIGSAAQFNVPHSAAVDSAGNVYVGDTFNHTIRKITPAGAVTTVAGLAGNKGYVDGVGTAEAPQFNSPIGLSADSAGNLYVSDNGNQTIRKVTPEGVVTTVAGQVAVKGSANGTGTGASFNSPNGTAVDSAGNVFVADLANRTIRKIAPGGAVTTFAGSTGLQGTNDGVGSTARFTAPMSIAVDNSNNLYVADQGGNTIRKITPGAAVTTLAGLGKIAGTNDGVGNAARFVGPEGVAVDSAGNVYVSDTGNDTIRKITPGGVVTTFAGTPGQIGSADGKGGAAQFYGPEELTVDGAGNIYVVEHFNNTVRQIAPDGTNWIVTTVAGCASCAAGTNDGTGIAARFNGPFGLTLDSSGNLYVADTGNKTIRKISPSQSEWAVTTFAGAPLQGGSLDGSGTNARFASPVGLAANANAIYVSDSSTIRKISFGGVV